jgi:phosphoglycolate phosphatase
MGLRQRMGTVVSGDTTENRKPHPDPVLLALKELGVAPGRAVYVGDAPQDIASGRAAGVITIAVRWGYIIPGTDPNDWRADYTIDRPDELAGLPALR